MVPETLTKNDLVVSLQGWDPTARKLSPVVTELVIHRTEKVYELRVRIASCAGMDLENVMVAKVSYFFFIYLIVIIFLWPTYRYNIKTPEECNYNYLYYVKGVT